MTGEKSALLIIDFQIIDFSRKQMIYKSESIITNIKVLIEKARKNNIPIFLTKHNGKLGSAGQKGASGWNIHPSVKLIGDEIMIEKDYPDAFQQTNLEAELISRNINHLVICGLETEVCVDTTCRSAFSKGYKVTIVKDGHSTYDSQHILAEHIINHHNEVFENWFATVSDTKHIDF